MGDDKLYVNKLCYARCLPRRMSQSAISTTPTAAATPATPAQARHRSQPNAIRTTPATQKEGRYHQVSCLSRKVKVDKWCKSDLVRTNYMWRSCVWTSYMMTSYVRTNCVRINFVWTNYMLTNYTWTSYVWTNYMRANYGWAKWRSIILCILPVM